MVDAKSAPGIAHHNEEYAEGVNVYFDKKSYFSQNWHLKGATDAKLLQEKDVHIWDGNSTREFLDSNGFYNYEIFI